MLVGEVVEVLGGWVVEALGGGTSLANLVQNWFRACNVMVFAFYIDSFL